MKDLTKRTECIHPRLKLDHVAKEGVILYRVGKCYDCPKEVVVTVAYREIVNGIYELREEYLQE